MGLELHQVGFSYGRKQVLAEIDFTIQPGEIVTLLGPSGIGKTTLLKIIAGLEQNYSGAVTFSEGYCLEETILVFQDFWLFPHMTVAENISFGLRMKKNDKKTIKEKVTTIIQKLQLEGLEETYPTELSGGQQQRVALARAIVLEPKLLLLDEPFSSLDANLRARTREYLLALQRDYQFSILLVTHDKEEAFQLSNRVAVLLDGRIVQIAKPKDLYFHPNSKPVADFLNEMNYLKGWVKSNQFVIAGAVEEAVKVVNSNHLSGDALLLLPYGQPFIFADQGLEGIIESVSWQPTGLRYSIRIGETICQFTNIAGQAEIGEQIFLTPTSEFDWQVMAS